MMTIFMKKFLQAVVQLLRKHSTAALGALIQDLIVPDEEYIMPWSPSKRAQFPGTVRDLLGKSDTLALVRLKPHSARGCVTVKGITWNDHSHINPHL